MRKNNAHSLCTIARLQRLQTKLFFSFSFFCSENAQSLNIPQKDLVGSPALDIFKMQLDRVLDNFILAPFSPQKRLNLIAFQRSLPAWAVLWFYESHLIDVMGHCDTNLSFL